MYNGTIDLNQLSNFSTSALENAVSFLKQINEQIKIFSDLRSSIETVQKVWEDLAPIFAKIAAEQLKANAATTAGAVASQADSAAKLTNTAITKALSQTNVLNATTKTAETAAATAATGAYKILNTVMTTSAGILGLIVVAVTAVITIITTLAAALNKGSAAFQAQKKEVEELASAQEKLAQSAQDSADSFDDSSARIRASGTVAKGLVDQMREVSASTEDAAAKHQQMAALCTQLNSTMDGLNLAYDKETGAITNLNTGQALSLFQIETLIAAKAKLAEADAWAERQNELLAEQVQIQEELALIEQQRTELQSEDGISNGNRNKLLNELAETEAAYATQMEENQARLAVVNENMATSSTESLGQIAANYGAVEAAVTSNGESIAQVAEQWGTTTEAIAAAMEAQNITLDEWVANQQEAWEEYQTAVSEKASAVVNSFQLIPDKFSMSAEQMLENLQLNKERYAEWEACIEEITRELGPTAAAEFSKLGPAAISAMQEILSSTALLEQYRQVFGVTIDEATGEAVENWSDPNFIGAPVDALTTSADQIIANSSLSQAMDDQIREMATTGKIAVVREDFGSIGKNAMLGIINGLKSRKETLLSTARSIASQVASTMRSALRINSPSKVMIDIFQNVMQGAINGMISMEGKTFHTASNIALGVADKLTLSPEQAEFANAKMLALSSTSLGAMPTSRTVQVWGNSSSSDNSSDLLQKAVDILDEYLPGMANMRVVLDTGATVGGMAPAMDAALGRRARKKARG